MRFDIVITIVIFSCITLCLGVFGLITYWMRKLHGSLLDQFSLIHTIFLVNEQEKGCDCQHGEKHNN